MRKGWEYKKLGEVAQIVSGATPKTNIEEYWGQGHYWVTPAELNDSTIYVNKTERQITDAALAKTNLQFLPKGTVLLSSRAPIGKVAICNTEMYCNQGFKNCICSEKLYNKYLFYYLKDKKEYLNSLGRGATFKEISKSIVENVIIPIPPKSTQLAIASELDKINELIRLKKEQLVEYDNLAQSIFYEMFGDPVENEKGFPICKVGEIYDFKYGKGNNIPEDKGEYLCYGSNGIVGHHTEFNSEDAPIIGHIGAYAGIVNWGVGKHYVTYNGVICKLKNKNFNKMYGYYMLKSQDYMHKIRAGIAQPFVSYSTLESPTTLVPPLPLQQSFASRIEQIEKLKSEVQNAITDLETLLASRMQYWFE